MGWEGINGLGILGGNYFIIFAGVWHPCNNLTIPYCSCSLSNCKKISHLGIYPWHHQSTYLFLLNHIYNVAYHRNPQNDGDPCHKVWQVWDYQGYLILIIALDSIHLNPYNIAYQSGKGITQTHTGDLSTYQVQEESYPLRMAFDQMWHDGVYLCTIIKEGH